MRRTLVVLVLVVSSLASANPEPQVSKRAMPTIAAALVEEQLIRPMAAKDEGRSKFSRALPPPTARRVRVIDREAQRDTAGKAFVRFAVDERRGWFDEDTDDNWTKNQITGCAYLDSREVFVKRGDAFHPAAAKLGKKTKAAAASVCTGASQVGSR